MPDPAHMRAPMLIVVLLAALIVGIEVPLVGAAPITSITDLNNFRNTQSINDVNPFQAGNDGNAPMTSAGFSAG